MTDARGPMLWGGRFSGAPDPDMLRLTSSISVDMALLDHDLAATKAHARVLVAAGLLDESDLPSLDAACRAIAAEWAGGVLVPEETDEDVHTFVERELTRRLGETGARIHAGRSRNDLVATDLRLWCRTEAENLRARTGSLIQALCERAAEHTESVMPGYTHLQRAQPVTLGFHLAAHGFALARDEQRFEAARKSADVCPLGAGALAGTTLPLDPHVAAGQLAFANIYSNATDAVADRDFACDLAYACALCAVHLSRLAEEVVLWSSAEFGYLVLPDEWTTGSSMMPQKRNPDVAELVRGRAAGAIADLGALLTILKGLPLAYNRDLQEDKGYVFAAAARLAGCLEAMTALVRGARFDTEAMEEAARSSAAWATDLAEALVGRGVPFREAHEATGRVVAALEAKAIDLAGCPFDLLEGVHDAFEPGDVELADPAASVRRRAGPGGPAPERVRDQIRELLEGRDHPEAGPH